MGEFEAERASQLPGRRFVCATCLGDLRLINPFIVKGHVTFPSGRRRRAPSLVLISSLQPTFCSCLQAPCYPVLSESDPGGCAWGWLLLTRSCLRVRTLLSPIPE